MVPPAPVPARPRASTAPRRRSSSPCAAWASSMSWCWAMRCAAASARWSTARQRLRDLRLSLDLDGDRAEVRDLAVHELAGRPREEIVRAVEQAAVVNSVANLMGFPWIAEKVAAGTLVLHAWWFNLTEGQLYAFNPDAAAFEAGARDRGPADGRKARRCRRSAARAPRSPRSPAGSRPSSSPATRSPRRRRPALNGTPAVFIASSVVARQPSSIGSLRSPMWPMRNTLPISGPSPPPSDRL